jgi:hypothetical protein
MKKIIYIYKTLVVMEVPEDCPTDDVLAFQIWQSKQVDDYVIYTVRSEHEIINIFNITDFTGCPDIEEPGLTMKETTSVPEREPVYNGPKLKEWVSEKEPVYNGTKLKEWGPALVGTIDYTGDPDFEEPETADDNVRLSPSFGTSCNG